MRHRHWSSCATALAQQAAARKAPPPSESGGRPMPLGSAEGRRAAERGVSRGGRCCRCLRLSRPWALGQARPLSAAAAVGLTPLFPGDGAHSACCCLRRQSHPHTRPRHRAVVRWGLGWGMGAGQRGLLPRLLLVLLVDNRHKLLEPLAQRCERDGGGRLREEGEDDSAWSNSVDRALTGG